MFLSKIVVDWKWARDPYQVHRALWHLFPDRSESSRDFLFRAEGGDSRHGLNVLLQSGARPRSSPVATLLACKAVEYHFDNGQRLHFYVRANPVKTIKDGRGRLTSRGEIKSCRIPLLKEEECLNWLARKLGDAAQLESVRTYEEPSLIFHKKGEFGKIQTLCYEGTLVVVRPDPFCDLLRKGIGPAKSMGCGLISLARA